MCFYKIKTLIFWIIKIKKVSGQKYHSVIYQALCNDLLCVFFYC